MSPQVRKTAVTTPAGHVGREVIRALLEQGEPVIAIGLERHRESLKALTQHGVEFRVASQDDAAGLADATQDAAALFWLTPPTLHTDMRQWYERTAQAGAAAIRRNAIAQVVNLSSLGAGAREGLGTVTYIGITEQILNAAAQNIVHLRPGYFMENLLLQREALAAGYFEYPYSPQHDIPWVAAKDIGRAAAGYLADPQWAGRWQTSIMGPENLTPAQLASRLTAALGRRIDYKQISFEDLRRAMERVGLLEPAVNDLILTLRALANPDGIYAQPRTPEAFTPTCIEEFAQAAGL